MATTRGSKRSHDSVNEKSVDVTTSRKSPKRSKRTTPVQVTPEKDPKSENGLKDTDIPIYVDKILKDAGIKNTKTRSGWCLKEGMIHILKADSGRMFPLVKQHGVPKVFASLGHCKNDNGEVEESGKQPETCFQSLCRIVVGAQVNANAASAFWTGLLRAVDGQLTPERVLQIEEEKGLKNGIQAPARISASKAKYIWNIAKAFEKGELSEEMLLNSDETKIREKLIKVSGIGPWSCDMFCMFYLKLPDVFPTGDFALRKGMKQYFNLKGSDKNGYLCQKKDKEKLENTFRPFAPYRSVVGYYMWKVVDSK